MPQLMRLLRKIRWVLVVIDGVGLSIVITSFWISAGYFASQFFVLMGRGCLLFVIGKVPPIGWGWFVHHQKVIWTPYYYSDARPIRFYALPLWPIVLASIFATVLAFRRAPIGPGHCLSCGYNLYGLVEPRCPECGTPYDSSS